MVSVGQGKNVCLLLQIRDTPAANACTSWGHTHCANRTVHETTLKIFLRCNKCKIGMCLKIMRPLSSIFCKQKSWFQILGIILLAIRSKKKHTSFSFDLPFKPTCSKMFYFAGRRRGIIHPVKIKCKPGDCVAFETNFEKKIVGEIDNTYCSIFGYEILRFGEMILHGS